MDTVRRNKHVFGNKIEEIQSSSHSSSSTSTPKDSNTSLDPVQSDATKSSLLVDPSNSFAVSYDMSLIDIDMSSYPAKVPAANESGTR